MKERGILFRDRLVRRINVGAKTQTRRIAALPPELHSLAMEATRFEWHSAERGWAGYTDGLTRVTEWFRCPYGVPGDRLWVREAWRTWERPADSVDGVIYRADNTFRAIENTAKAADQWVEAHDNGRHGDKWRPSIFMPRWASRTTLDIAVIRLERLHAITAEDALAEGVELGEPVDAIVNGKPSKVVYFDARVAFAHLWCGVNGPDAWKANPWVWVLEFSRAAQVARAA